MKLMSTEIYVISIYSYHILYNKIYVLYGVVALSSHHLHYLFIYFRLCLKKFIIIIIIIIVLILKFYFNSKS